MPAKKRIKVQTKAEETVSENDTLKENDSDEEDKEKIDDPLKDMEANLASLKQEAKENYDRFLRISADFENYKKRSVREMNDFRKFANESLVLAMLPVIDNLERALESTGDDQSENQSVVEGVQMTLSEILKIFEKFHVNQIESVGKPFDPGFHQAVMQQETDNHPDKTVLKELQKGYLMHDKLIRPAMVVVSKNKTTTENQKNNAQENKE